MFYNLQIHGTVLSKRITSAVAKKSVEFRVTKVIYRTKTSFCSVYKFWNEEWR